MAKKNFDDFINAAGKKPKPTPEEVEAMAKQLHQSNMPTPTASPSTVKTQQTVTPTKPAAPKLKSAKVPTSQKSVVKNMRIGRGTEPADAPKEKVRITIDLAKDLYKRMKLAVVQNETEISAYVRQLIENDLDKS